jgi:hypothetical protein
MPLDAGDIEPLCAAPLNVAPASAFNLMTAVNALATKGVEGQLRIYIHDKGHIEIEFFGLTPASEQPR